jgi:hypothetical protein
MARKKKKKEPVHKTTETEKETWPLYSLQQLTPSRFTDVVGKILKGTYSLVFTKFRRGHSDFDEPSE